jgi:hypothetical protein
MRTNKLLGGLLAMGLYSLTANACFLQFRVACPNDATVSGIGLIVSWDKGNASTEIFTDSLGIAGLYVGFGTVNVCVDAATLPAGARVSPQCQRVTVDNLAPPVVTFGLSGDFCRTPPPQGQCWMTGGGTIERSGNTPHYSYGGVVYPGCSPFAADGGNWNVVDHITGLHFQGQHIIVDNCSGVPTDSPPVNVNIIDFHGIGIVDGIGTVTFVGRAIDNHDGGHGADKLFISVSDGGGVVLQIGNSAADPATVDTGNLQIHTSSCGN